jgi:hypothetical protein
MTDHDLEKALQALEFLAGQLELLEPDFTRSSVTEARLFASTLRCSRGARATADGRAEAVANACKVCELLTYLTARVSELRAITA